MPHHAPLLGASLAHNLELFNIPPTNYFQRSMNHIARLNYNKKSISFSFLIFILLIGTTKVIIETT